MKQFLLMLMLALLSPGGVLAQDRAASWPGAGLERGAHAVGFKAVFLYDYSRTYQVQEDAKDQADELHARPMALAVWYPAVADPGASKMTYREYVHLISKEETFGEMSDEDRAQAEGALTGMARSMGASAEKLERILASRTGAVRDAVPEKGRFPVVVYAPSFGSFSIENDVLCEVLAGHGYVVVASSSKGMHAADMTLDFEGAEAQTRDMEFAVAALHDLPYADPSRIAAVGFSWGGLSAVVLALRNSNVKAVVTLDGSVHNKDIYDLMKYAYFHGSHLRAALLQVRSKSRGPDGSPANPTWDVHRFSKEARYVDTFLLLFEHLVHWNNASGFNKLLFLANEDREKFIVKDFDLDVIDTGYTLIARYCRRFLDAYLKGDAEGFAYLKRTPEENGVPAGRLTLSRHAAVARPPSEAAFLAMIREQGIQAALEVYERVAAEDPGYKLFTFEAMGLLGRELFDAGAVDDALAVLKLNVRTYPEEYRVYFGLGNVYAFRGEHEAAVAAFRKALELSPDSPYAKERLEELEALVRDP
ncbi:MAG: tetratricopeptide repeat protein [bacterium]|nr:tetratricopeptide repeat protein [bacterium]